MEDLFYFSLSELTLADLAAISQKTGYPYQYDEFTGSLSVFYDRSEHWEWAKLYEIKGDFDSMEPLERDIIARYQPVSSFSVSHHVRSMPRLLPLLKHILTEYGGWVGCDSENFEPIYTADNIEEIAYPYPTAGD